MKPTQKKPITAFTVISTIILLLLTVLFIFPFYWILTGPLISARYHYDPTSMVAKDTNHGKLPTVDGTKPSPTMVVE